MNSLEIASIKRDLSGQVETVFDELEQENNGLPTLEEFRARFASCVDDYLEAELRQLKEES